MKSNEKHYSNYSAAIIVPVYGAVSYLEMCMNSLLKQDYDNYQIILVDDCSTDGSLQIAERYEKEYPDKVSLIRNEENIGQGRSRMKAIETTQADYILFVDSDDYISEDYISTFMRENDDHYDIVVAGHTRDIDGRLKPITVPDSPYTLVLYSVACCKMFRREYLTENRIDFTDSRKGEDIFFSLAIFACDPHYKIIGYTGYYYRLNRNSTTKSMDYETGFENNVMSMFAQFRERYRSRIDSDDKKTILEYAYAANIANALIVYNHGCGRKRMKEKLKTVDQDISDNYPGLMQNKETRFFRPETVSLKIRTGVGAFYWSRRLHLDGILFGLISLI